MPTTVKDGASPLLNHLKSKKYQNYRKQCLTCSAVNRTSALSPFLFGFQTELLKWCNCRTPV